LDGALLSPSGKEAKANECAHPMPQLKPFAYTLIRG